MGRKVAECVKQRHDTEQQAFGAARNAQRRGLTAMFKVGTYQCDQCRFPSGKRAWHWGNKRPAKVRGRSHP